MIITTVVRTARIEVGAWRSVWLSSRFAVSLTLLTRTLAEVGSLYRRLKAQEWSPRRALYDDANGPPRVLRYTGK